MGDQHYYSLNYQKLNEILIVEIGINLWSKLLYNFVQKDWWPSKDIDFITFDNSIKAADISLHNFMEYPKDFWGYLKSAQNGADLFTGSISNGGSVIFKGSLNPGSLSTELWSEIPTKLLRPLTPKMRWTTGAKLGRLRGILLPFVEGIDFIKFNNFIEQVSGPKGRIEYALIIDMSKEISMVQK